MVSYSERLFIIAQVLLKEEIHFLELMNSLADLKAMCLEISGLDFEDTSHEENILLRSGKAIGTKWAGMCIDDLLRTKRFVKGVYNAVERVRHTKENEPVRILYSGTGPFASLVLPLITLYSSSEIQFTLLEVNSVSFESLKDVFRTLDALEYIHEIKNCDAASELIEDAQKIDILLIECMQQALAREPQVAITYNLVSQCKKEVVLIPEEVSLQVTFINSNKYMENLQNTTGESIHFCESSSPVFILNKEEVQRKLEGPQEEILKFPEIKTLFTQDQLKAYNEIAITTEIKVFENERLSLNDSGLTIPFIFSHYSKGQKIKGVNSQYVTGPSPELKVEIIS